MISDLFASILMHFLFSWSMFIMLVTTRRTSRSCPRIQLSFVYDSTGFVWYTVLVLISSDHFGNGIIFIQVGKTNRSCKRKSSEFGYILAMGFVLLGTCRRTPQLGTS